MNFNGNQEEIVSVYEQALGKLLWYISCTPNHTQNVSST